MKKILFVFLILTLTGTYTFSQSSKTKDMLAKIEGQYEVDDSGNVTYVKVIDNLPIDEKQIFDRALSYYVYKYNDANSVIQEKNEDAGRIIGKGIYPDVHIGMGLLTRYFSAVHILRIDIKDRRCRVLLTLTEYNIKTLDLDGIAHFNEKKLINSYPIDPKGGEKTFYGKAFFNTHLAVVRTFEEVERVIKEGVTFSNLDDDWD